MTQLALGPQASAALTDRSTRSERSRKVGYFLTRSWYTWVSEGVHGRWGGRLGKQMGDLMGRVTRTRHRCNAARQGRAGR